jgi:hypothetical protein
MRKGLLLSAAFLLGLAVSSTASAERIVCESRNFERNYCVAGERISSVRLVHQRSRARCSEGRTWGYDNRGIWVTDGCSGEFDFKRAGGDRRGRQIACASRNFEQQYCPSGGRRIARAWLVEQRSRAACVQGRSWGYDDNGIWVSSGCNGLFAVEEGRGPGPRPVNAVECESRDYRYAFCPAGRPIRHAWLQEQRSRTVCIEGDNWGVWNGGIWVDNGCSGVFAYDMR